MIIFQRSSGRIIFLNMYEESAARVMCLVSDARIVTNMQNLDNLVTCNLSYMILLLFK